MPRSCGTFDNRRGERMLAASLERCGETRARHFHRSLLAGTTSISLRLADGQRAGLVDHQRVDLLHQLERFGILDEHASAVRRGRSRP